jgi:hypothetical protein
LGPRFAAEDEGSGLNRTVTLPGKSPFTKQAALVAATRGDEV